MINFIIDYIRKNTTFGKTRYLNYLYQYDLKQYYENSGLNQENKADAMATQIRILAHTIEKGLSLPEARPGFGKAKIQHLIELNEAYRHDHDGKDVQINALVHSTVASYCEFQEQVGIDISFVPTEYRKVQDERIRAGVKYFKAKTGTEFEEIARNRHSSRSFSDRPIQDETLIQVVALAQTAPSACNRQATRIYACTNQNKIKCVLEFHGGLRGFDVPAVIFAVTGDLHLYQNEYERNTVFVDGGIFVMNLLYSLDSFGILSCPIIWGSEPDKDEKLSGLMGIPRSEKIISLVVAGYSRDDTYKAALSPKRETKDILKIVK